MYEKTGEAPVKRGETKYGALLFLFKESDQAIVEDQTSQWKLTFIDVADKSYEIKFDNKNPLPGPFQVYPGVGSPNR